MCRENSPLILLVVLLLTASCSTTPPSTGDRAPLTGMVYDTEGRPVQGARVRIDGTQETTTDLNGRFVTPPLDTGTHLLLINREGYEEQRTRVEFYPVLWRCSMSASHPSKALWKRRRTPWTGKPTMKRWTTSGGLRLFSPTIRHCWYSATRSFSVQADPKKRKSIPGGSRRSVW
ncbi:carboxypeptidase-like regulatory domain-containing protein [Marispirochaeta sp.]|uniref:carboxypeptidase-like regulatory domain-containing protein n=1 Tax=Marispirochaeta sp. TaxID=2038653 RepID=UPI0029C82CA9|nr:carboxypeptidase-like regulatory domain-containing protein [Marispirochaeta sp.]